MNNSMELETAKQVAKAASVIEKRTPIIERLEMFKRDGWIITGIRIKSKDGSQHNTEMIDPFDAKTSEDLLGYIISLCQKHVSDSQEELNSIKLESVAVKPVEVVADEPTTPVEVKP